MYDNQTEILTKDGWIKGLYLQDDPVIAVINRNTNKMEWEKATGKTVKESTSLLHFKTMNVNLAVTHDQGLVYKRGDDKLKFCTAEDLAVMNKHKVRWVHGANISGGIKHDHRHLQILTYLVTDGTVLRYGGWRWGFKKQRKINALESLLNSANVEYTKTVVKGGVTFIYVNKPNTVKVAGFLTGKKDMTDKWLKLDRKSCKAVVDAWRVTDGWSIGNNDNCQLCTTIENHADLIQMISFRAGYRASKTVRSSGLFTINVNENTESSSGRMVINTIPYNGLVWGYDVDGLLITRRCGRIVITQ